MKTNKEQIKFEELRMNDKYDDAMEYLIEHPEDIYEAWSTPGDMEGRGGELFGFVAPQWDDASSSVYNTDGVYAGTCGCLQQIRKEKVQGGTGKSGTMCMSHWPRLWENIARDVRIPSEADEIGVEDLPVFAEWQREIDALRARIDE